MNKTTHVVTLAALAASAAAAVACAPPSDTSADVQEDERIALLASLRTSTDHAVQRDACEDLLDDREHHIEALMSILEEAPAGSHSGQSAGLLLGKHRAPEAVDLLVEKVDFTPAFSKSVHPLGGWPCAMALWEIGRPSVDGILRAMDKPQTELRIHLFSVVLKEILGEEAAWTRVRQAWRETMEETTEANLHALLEELKE